MQQLVRLSIVHKRLGISRQAAYNWARRGMIPGVIKLNDVWLVDEQALEQWLDAEHEKAHTRWSEYMSAKTARTGTPKSKSVVSHVEYQPTSPEARDLLKKLSERRNKSNGDARKIAPVNPT